MKNKNRLVFGTVLVLWGTLSLIGMVAHINVWAYFWPVVLIGLGLWLIAKPGFSYKGVPVTLRPLADIRRDGEWIVKDEEFWILVGDVDLDLTRAVLPPGETRIRLFGFVGNVELLIPEDIGVAISSHAFVTDAKVLGENIDHFWVPYSNNSSNYLTAEKKLVVESGMFVASIKVQQL